MEYLLRFEFAAARVRNTMSLVPAARLEEMD